MQLKLALKALDPPTHTTDLHIPHLPEFDLIYHSHLITDGALHSQSLAKWGRQHPMAQGARVTWSPGIS